MCAISLNKAELPAKPPHQGRAAELPRAEGSLVNPPSKQGILETALVFFSVRLQAKIRCYCNSPRQCSEAHPVHSGPGATSVSAYRALGEAQPTRPARELRTSPYAMCAISLNKAELPAKPPHQGRAAELPRAEGSLVNPPSKQGILETALAKAEGLL